MPLTNAQKEKLKFFMEKDVKILRQVVYKELMEWRRTVYEKDDKLNVEGEIRKAMVLSEGDKQFIDSQIQWFLLGAIPDSILLPYAKQTLESLKGNDKPTFAQKNLQQELQSALTVEQPVNYDEPPF